MYNTIRDAIGDSKLSFLRRQTNVWDLAITFPKARKGHPAPFPIQLPMRFMEFYLPKGGLVCDPFHGSGTVGQGVVKLNRKYRLGYHWIGFDISEEYIKIANEFIENERTLED